ncbi:CHAP domain-containing protein [Inconstantimicrobium mannanitabidum]|uniref:CHAP domain-containing protein n=1 Tax=Inconstantimicrobium mannanitabidum TaxID=1604901 RepID=A0ACB5RDG6_9CLOT|nr:CHAP domain-containing protein [Clostridium sp. TW13]GKX67312.1 CHAP domain-containing protein [Clostridium sp. TW13]
MRKKWVKIVVVIIAILLGVVTIYLLTDRKKIGKEIDSYKNVKVYYNGAIYTKSYGKNYSGDGYYYGYKWQCVEFVKRFYYEAKEHKMPDVYGNAKDFFDPSLNQGELNEHRGLVQYRNGDDVSPEADDLIVFTDTKFGHVAIVTAVTSDYVEVIQQNVYGKTREKYSLTIKDGKYFVGDKRKPAGWLRKK